VSFYFIFLFIYLFIYLFIHSFIYLFIYLLIYLFIYLYIHSFFMFFPIINQEYLVILLGEISPLPVTYAGGARSIEDLQRVTELGKGKVSPLRFHFILHECEYWKKVGTVINTTDPYTYNLHASRRH